MRKTILSVSLAALCLAVVSGCAQSYKRSIWNPKTQTYESRGGD